MEKLRVILRVCASAANWIKSKSDTSEFIKYRYCMDFIRFYRWWLGISTLEAKNKEQKTGNT